MKHKIGACITENENLSDDDRKYLRTVLKLGNVYAAILNRQEYEMPRNTAGLDIDVKRLNNLLCRLTRRYLKQPKTECMDSFRISPNGYSYKDGAMRIVCRIPRKRIAIPLKDDRTFDRQIQVIVRKNDVVLAVPVETKIKNHADYTGTIYVHIGSQNMFTLSNGHIYGASLEGFTDSETERLTWKNRERRKMYTAYTQSVESGNAIKAEKITVNNLGKSKKGTEPQHLSTPKSTE